MNNKSKDKDKGQQQPMQQGLLTAMSSLDRQVARDVAQRSAREQDERGVGRSPAIKERIELISTFLIDKFSEENIQLDSLLILAQAFSKSLAILASELGEDNLGVMRTAECKEAFKNILQDSERALSVLQKEQFVN